MKGLAPHTAAIIDRISRLECLDGWTLVGGTALAIQLGHRQSEDLDFMRWQSESSERMEIDWPTIKRDLEQQVGRVQSMDILESNHVEFLVEGVKISFYARECRTPVRTTLPFRNRIVLADIEAIAAMKLEVMMRRSKFRDYYDIYCITLHDPDLMKFVRAAGRYSNHLLKSKHLLALLTNHQRFAEDHNFAQLAPLHAVSAATIEEHFKGLLLQQRND